MNTFLVQSLICAFALADVAKGGAITLTNHGFEAGLTGWTTTGQIRSSGTQLIITQGAEEWDINPFQQKMAYVEGREVPLSQLDPFLGLPVGTLNANAQFGPLFEGAAIYQDFIGEVGDSITMYWAYVARDYVPLNDPAFAVLVNPDGSSELRVLASIRGGGSEVGPGGHAPWQQVSFTLTQSGPQRLGFVAADTIDSRHSPVLALDNQPGTSATPGLTHTTPFRTDGNVAVFPDPKHAGWYGVPVATSLTYEVFGDSFFDGFTAPPSAYGFGNKMTFTDLTNGNSFEIGSGGPIGLAELQVKRFRISGIPTNAMKTSGLLAKEFPVELSFDGDPRLLTITAVPEPSSLAMMGIAAALGIARLRRKRYAAHSPRPNSSE